MSHFHFPASWRKSTVFGCPVDNFGSIVEMSFHGRFGHPITVKFSHPLVAGRVDIFSQSLSSGVQYGPPIFSKQVEAGTLEVECPQPTYMFATEPVEQRMKRIVIRFTSTDPSVRLGYATQLLVTLKIYEMRGNSEDSYQKWRASKAMEKDLGEDTEQEDSENDDDDNDDE